MAFDLLQLGGHAVMAAPCVDRRKRLEDVFTAGAVSPQLALVPAFEAARRLWTVWVGSLPRGARPRGLRS